MNKKKLISLYDSENTLHAPRRSKHITTSQQPLIDFPLGSWQFLIFQLGQLFSSPSLLALRVGPCSTRFFREEKKTCFTRGNLIQVLNSFLLSSSFCCKPNSVVGFTESQNRKDICSEVTQGYDVDQNTGKIINHKATES